VVKLIGRKLPRKGQKGSANVNRKFRNELNDILVAFSQREKRERFRCDFGACPKFRHTRIFVTEHKWKSLNYIKTARVKSSCFNRCNQKSKIKILLKKVKYEIFQNYEFQKSMLTCKIENKEISPVAFAPGAPCEINYN
jgi:hypothetical protein